MNLFDQAKPYLAAALIQICYAFMSVISKLALNQGLSQRILVPYRMAVATIVIAPFAYFIERKSRPKMTTATFIKIALLSLLEPVLSQNLYFTGMKLTTATFTAAMCNVLPVVTFLLAWTFKLESVNVRKMHSLAKVLGTIVSVGGAMSMTLLKGPILQFPWTSRVQNHHNHLAFVTTSQKRDHVKGALVITAACFSWSCFIVLQTLILKSYPAELTLAALICMTSMVEGALFAFALERGNTEIWTIHLDVKLLAVVYGGIFSSLSYYIMGWLMKQKGPVFVSSFSPLGMVMVAIVSSFFLPEQFFLGRVIGAVLVVIGLYMYLWGKSKDVATTSKITENKAEQNDRY